MATDSPSPAAQPRRRSWLRRNWLWFVPAVFVLLIVVGAGVVLALFAQKKSTEPYRMAWEKVRKAPQVIERLGEPIRDASWFPTGFVHSEDRRGEASLGFSVAGPKGQAHVAAQARQVAGQWGLTVLEVRAEGAATIKLDTRSGDEGDAPKFNSNAPPNPEGGGDAPRWQPTAPPAAGTGQDPPKWDPPKSVVPEPGGKAAGS